MCDKVRDSESEREGDNVCVSEREKVRERERPTYIQRDYSTFVILCTCTVH